MSTRDNPTPAQSKQRKLYLTLGYVTAFPGYLNMLIDLVREVQLDSRVDATHLYSSVNIIRNELASIEAQIRQSMKEIPK